MLHIPVAYSTDDNYAFVLIVSITSLVLNSNEGTFYDIYILIDNSFGKKKEVEKSLERFEGRLKIEFINVGKRFEKVYLRYDIISSPTYFRLALPELLKEDKCIYLDVDTIICRDLGQLYEVNLASKYIAGIKAPCFHIREDNEQYCKQARLPSMNQYINAGVLLLNLEEMRKHDLASMFMDYLKYDMECQDQDIINSCCYGKIKILPFRYNVMTKYAEWGLADYKGCYSKIELIDAWNNPCIIHYADRIKPWNLVGSCMGEFWWRACRNNDYAWAYYTQKYSIKFMMKTIFNVMLHSSEFTKMSHVPKLFNLGAKRTLALYGAGKRAAEVMRYMSDNDIVPNMIIVKDGKNNPKTVNNIVVVQLNKLKKMQTDTTLIIATRESIHEEIMQDIEEFSFGEIIFLNDNWKY